MAYLGSLENEVYADVATIASKAGAPPNYLGKLLRILARSGLLEARKGAGGGFRLMREASGITLFEALDPIEELISEKHCILGEGRCGESGPCALHPAWSRLRSEMLSFLHTTRLDTLVHAEISRN
jgi:Rrf2 family protein